MPLLVFRRHAALIIDISFSPPRRALLLPYAVAAYGALCHRRHGHRRYYTAALPLLIFSPLRHATLRYAGAVSARRHAYDTSLLMLFTLLPRHVYFYDDGMFTPLRHATPMPPTMPRRCHITPRDDA